MKRPAAADLHDEDGKGQKGTAKRARGSLAAGSPAEDPDDHPASEMGKGSASSTGHWDGGQELVPEDPVGQGNSKGEVDTAVSDPPPVSKLHPAGKGNCESENTDDAVADPPPDSSPHPADKGNCKGSASSTGHWDGGQEPAPPSDMPAGKSNSEGEVADDAVPDHPSGKGNSKGDGEGEVADDAVPDPPSDIPAGKSSCEGEDDDDATAAEMRQFVQAHEGEDDDDAAAAEMQGLVRALPADEGPAAAASGNPADIPCGKGNSKGIPPRVQWNPPEDPAEGAVPLRLVCVTAFLFPTGRCGWSNLDWLTWLVRQHSPGLPAVLEFFGVEVQSGNVTASGTLEETLQVGRSLITDLIVRKPTDRAQEQIKLVLQQRKVGATSKIDVCCKRGSAEYGWYQMGSQAFHPDADGKYNQIMFLHILFAWRCVMLCLAHDQDNDGRWPSAERVQTMCTTVKEYIADVQAGFGAE